MLASWQRDQLDVWSPGLSIHGFRSPQQFTAIDSIISLNSVGRPRRARLRRLRFAHSPRPHAGWFSRPRPVRLTLPGQRSSTAFWHLRGVGVYDYTRCVAG